MQVAKNRPLGTFYHHESEERGQYQLAWLDKFGPRPGIAERGRLEHD